MKKKQLLAIILLSMKITFIQIALIATFSCSLFANTTEGQAILDKQVTISVENMEIGKLISKVQQQTGVQFLFSSNTLDAWRKISCVAKNEKLGLFIEKTLKPLGIGYRIVGEQILLFSEIRGYIPKAEESPSLFIPVNRIIKGKVTDEKGEALRGATILLKGGSTMTTTSADGSFSIEVPDDAKTLVVSYTGMEDQELSISGLTEVQVRLKQINIALSDVVVVGYGTQKKVNLTGSVSSISAADIDSRPLTQTSQALAGLASGVTVSQGSGRPGNDGAGINIRGLGTFSNAGNSPLILIDGLASSINDVDPNNIQSFSVLKDAASASIYGTRAANGVILIETKRGQKGKLQISYNNYLGWQKATELPAFLESAGYAEMRNEANNNMGQGKTYSDADIEKFRTGSDPDKYPNVPHLKNLLHSGSGFQNNHNLSFTGGDGKNAYLFSMGYLHQDGIVAKNDYNKYNFLLNLDSKITDNLTLKVNLSGNSAVTDEPRQYDGEMTNMIGFAVREGPIYAGKKSDGTYGYQDNFSPEAWLDSKSFVKRKSKYFLGGAELAWEIIPGLTISGKAGYNYTNYNDNSYAASFVFDQFKTVGPSNLTVYSGDNALLTLQSLAQYTKTIQKHRINVLAGYSQEQYREDWTRSYRDKFPNNSLFELNAGASSNMQAFGSGSEWALRSFFGRLNYSFNDKYLFEANARYDGTSRFPANGRWGLFPSFSAGWRISEESFIKDDITWINNLKLRASWGELGNQNIGNYPYQNKLNLGQNYTFGGSLVSGARLTTLANPDITWETTRITDIGLDMDILNGRLGLVFDYFNKVTSGILYNISVSQVLGLGTSEVNAGEVKNSGFEVLLKYKTSVGKLNIGIIPNFSYVQNKVSKLGNNLNKDIGKNLFVGQPLNAIYGYEADGLFVSADDIAKYPTQPYSAQPGFVRYKDINGPDGVPDGKVDATYDRTVIGTRYPKYSYGATITADYNGFDFSVLLHGLAGFEKQMGSYQAFAFYNGGQIQKWQADNRWTEANPDPNAKYIKLTSLNMGSGTIQTSTFWNRNASFVRVKNLQLGYSFSHGMIQKMKLNRLRIFFSGQNLFSLNHFYKGWDPEMSQSTGDNTPFYPITSVYTFGVNVRF
jgi:TonB-dependent starch-binding outer membrane protein SusC